MKCPYCGNDTLHPVTHDDPDIRYVITTADMATKEFHPNNGLPVILYGCQNCKSLHIKCDKL